MRIGLSQTRERLQRHKTSICIDKANSKYGEKGKQDLFSFIGNPTNILQCIKVTIITYVHISRICLTTV